MQHDRVELIAGLCTQAGMILEDASVRAVSVAAVASDALARELAGLEQDAQAAATLIAAARALCARLA